MEADRPDLSPHRPFHLTLSVAQNEDGELKAGQEHEYRERGNLRGNSFANSPCQRRNTEDPSHRSSDKPHWVLFPAADVAFNRSNNGGEKAREEIGALPAASGNVSAIPKASKPTTDDTPTSLVCVIATSSPPSPSP